MGETLHNYFIKKNTRLKKLTFCQLNFLHFLKDIIKKKKIIIALNTSNILKALKCIQPFLAAIIVNNVTM